MKISDYDTLSGAIKRLNEQGFTDDFKAEEDYIIALYSKHKYQPDELTIVRAYRYDGATNPQDETEVFAIKANDGIKGTLVMSYSAEHNQNTDLIRKIKIA